jgi:hypothetical protein
MTQPVVSLLDTSEDLMPMPSNPSDSGPDAPSSDAYDLICDLIESAEAARDDRDNRGRNLEKARTALDEAEREWLREEMRRTKGAA